MENLETCVANSEERNLPKPNLYGFVFPEYPHSKTEEHKSKPEGFFDRNASGYYVESKIKSRFKVQTAPALNFYDEYKKLLLFCQ